MLHQSELNRTVLGCPTSAHERNLAKGQNQGRRLGCAPSNPTGSLIRQKPGRNKMREKFMNMSDEEREAFKQRMKERCEK